VINSEGPRASEHFSDYQFALLTCIDFRKDWAHSIAMTYPPLLPLKLLKPCSKWKQPPVVPWLFIVRAVEPRVLKNAQYRTRTVANRHLFPVEYLHGLSFLAGQSSTPKDTPIEPSRKWIIIRKFMQTFLFRSCMSYRVQIYGVIHPMVYQLDSEHGACPVEIDIVLPTASVFSAKPRTDKPDG
jgi:hypothetical protein